MRNIVFGFILTLLTIGQTNLQTSNSVNTNNMKQADTTDRYTFQLSDKVTRQKVTFKNRYGIILTGDLYTPKNSGNNQLPALVISGPRRPRDDRVM